MHINNKCGWIEWFSVPNILLEFNTGLTRQAIFKSRNVLKQYGLIDFRLNGTKATEYKMNTMSNSLQVGCQVSCQDSLQVSCQDSCQDSLQVGCTLNKLNKTKLNKTKQKRKEKKEKHFTPPSLEEVQAYVKDKGLNVDATKFFNYYEATEWKDKEGNQVLSWKGKAQTWDSRAEKDNAKVKSTRGATFADLLKEEYGDEQERNHADNESNPNIISKILPEYDIR